MPTRRDLIAAGLLAPILIPAGRRRRRRPLLPRVNGGINVQPLRRMDTVSDFTPPLVIPELVRLQMKEVYELGFRRMRITISFSEFGPDFFAAIPYVRIARALGIEVLAIIDQFGGGFDLLRALADPLRRAHVLEAHHAIFCRPVKRATRRVRSTGRVSFQILNEPTDSRGLPPVDYVTRFLAPVTHELRRIDPAVEVVAAATVGRRAGIWRLREMLSAGLERACDRVAVHVYDRAGIADLRGLIRAPVSVTETAAIGTDGHLDWVLSTYPEIEAALPPIDDIYWFDLFDFEPGVFRIIDVFENEDGTFGSSVESTALHSYWRERVAGAAGSRTHATFDELIPDVAAYLPTGEDFAIADAARLA